MSESRAIKGAAFVFPALPHVEAGTARFMARHLLRVGLPSSTLGQLFDGLDFNLTNSLTSDPYFCRELLQSQRW